MEWKFDEKIINSLIGKKVNQIFGTYIQIFRDKDNLVINELNKITLEIDNEFYEIKKGINKFSDIDLYNRKGILQSKNWQNQPVKEIETDKIYTCDSGYGLCNDKIVVLEYLDDWENYISQFGYLFNTKTDIKEGFYIELNDYKKIFVLEIEVEKVASATYLEDWEFVVSENIPENCYCKNI